MNENMAVTHQFQQYKKNNLKIAVVGSGPSGLSFAGCMAQQGFDVYVFEALHENWWGLKIWYTGI